MRWMALAALPPAPRRAQHAENALDLYDEALQYADDDDGMEVESVNAAAWRAVVLKYEILTIDPKQAPFISPLALLAAERKKQAAAKKKPSTVAGGAANAGAARAGVAAGRMAGRRKSVATRKEAYVYELVESAVASNFLFRSVPQRGQIVGRLGGSI